MNPHSELVLYHGTTDANAADLLLNGFDVSTWRSGGNGGRRRLLYLTSDPDDARWFSNEAGCDIVLSVTVRRDALIVDPEDGIGATVEDELSHETPAKLAAHAAIPARSFSWVEMTPLAGECLNGW